MTAAVANLARAVKRSSTIDLAWSAIVTADAVEAILDRIRDLCPHHRYCERCNTDICPIGPDGNGCGIDTGGCHNDRDMCRECRAAGACDICACDADDREGGDR